jgi:hypothetical protein
MKRLLQTVFLAFLAISFASAQTAAVETFDYTVGAAGGLGSSSDAGWGGAWVLRADSVSDSIQIVSGSLGLTGLSTTGNKLELRSYDATASSISRTLASYWSDVAGAEYWISFLFEVTNPDANNSSWQGFSLDSAGKEKFYMGKLWGDEYLGFNVPSPYLNVLSSYSYTSGVAWLVTKIKMSGSTSIADTAYMWINPDPSKTPAIADADISSAVTFSSGFNSIRLHLGESSGIVEQFDEIRLGTSWDEVTSPVTTSVIDKASDKLDITVLNNVAAKLVTFDYSLNSGGFVKLEIINIEGKVVSTLVNGNQQSGSHSIQLNTSGFQKGIYLYRIKLGGTYKTGKLLLF